MINSKQLMGTVDKYKGDCADNDKKPTYSELARRLGICPDTIRHVISGCYKPNKPYTDRPNITRCFSNADFSLITELYKDANADEES